MSPNGTLERILELGFAFRGAKVLMSAVELGVFTALAEGPLECSDLRQQLGVAERGARDFFDALVALGLLTRDEQADTPMHPLPLALSTRISQAISVASSRT